MAKIKVNNRFGYKEPVVVERGDLIITPSTIYMFIMDMRVNYRGFLLLNLETGILNETFSINETEDKLEISGLTEECEFIKSKDALISFFHNR